MKLKLMQWNMRGYFSRLPYLHNAIDNIQPDIICLQETFLKRNKSIRLPSFQHPPARKDRPDKVGGGVLICVHKSIPYIDIEINSNLEVVAIQVLLPSRKITICSLYIPPDYDNSQLTSELNSLQQVLPQPFMICSDSNAHHPSWGSPQANQRGKLINDWLIHNQLALLNTDEPTYISSGGNLTHIDLTITTADIAPLFTWHPHLDNFDSDHFPIILDSSLTIPVSLLPEHWHLKTAKWKSFTNQLNLPIEFLSPSQACGVVTDTFLAAAKDNIQRSRPAPPHGKSNCWWNKECAAAHRKKNRALSHYRLHLGNMGLWIAFKEARAHFRYAVTQAKRSSWRTFVAEMNSNTNSTEIWQKIRLLSSRPTSRTIVLKINGNVIADPKQVADAIAQQISAKSLKTSTQPQLTTLKHKRDNLTITFLADNSQWYNAPIQLKELNQAINTSTSKSPGPDSIPFAFLKHLSSEQSLHLLKFYNYLWENGFPHQWREAIIIPILKPGKPAHDCSSYRPIALTNCLCKIMEKIANWRLQAFLEKTSHIDPCQSGFRAGRCTMDSLSRLEAAAKDSIAMGSYCVSVFLDITQAFDSVGHHGLLVKIDQLGLKGNLAKFIQQFLHLRRFSVRIQGTHSNQYPTYCGVPQGSVISPTLFNIMINDLFKNLPSDISHSLYADDGALWITHNSLDVALQTMQEGMNSVQTWSQKWGLEISNAKTKAMIFTLKRKNNPTALIINNNKIEFVPNFKFLGLTFDSKLTWNVQINSLHAHCQRDLRLLSIVAAQKWGADYTTLRCLYIALIRSKLDYGCFLYETASATNLKKIDRIQFSAIRIMLGALRCTPNCLLEAEANLMPLHTRRKLIMSLYISKTFGNQEHPIRELTLNYKPLQKYFDKPIPLPVTGRMWDELQKMQMPLSELPPFFVLNKYLFHELPVYSTLAANKKSTVPAEHWLLLFKDLLEQYPERVPVYCDGSLRNGVAGSGVWCRDFKLMCRLPTGASIITAELYAIYSAISYLTNQPGKFIIFTDSLSSILSLKHTHRQQNYLISKIADAFSKLTTKDKIVLEWIPSHMGIPGNEKADTIAAQSLKLNNCNAIPLPIDDIKKKIKVHYNNEWQEAWTSQHPTTTEMKPILGHTVCGKLPRPLQVCLTRLRLKTCLLTHEHFFARGIPAAVCATCQCAMSLQHLLLECPVFAIERTPLLAECHLLHKSTKLSTILNPDYPCDIIIKYLRDISYLSKI